MGTYNSLLRKSRIYFEVQMTFRLMQSTSRWLISMYQYLVEQTITTMLMLNWFWILQREFLCRFVLFTWSCYVPVPKILVCLRQCHILLYYACWTKNMINCGVKIFASYGYFPTHCNLNKKCYWFWCSLTKDSKFALLVEHL